MTTKFQHTYAIGDRVAERPKAHGLAAVREETKARIAQYRSQRYGTVVGFNNKPNKLGRAQKFLLIKWDHLKSPTEHAQMRICPINELTKLQANGYGTGVE
jgi:hypothetical protein